MISLLATQFTDLNATTSGREVISFQLGWQGEVVILTRERSRGPLFNYSLHRVLETGVATVHLPTSEDVLHAAVSLPGDGWCVIGEFVGETPFSTRIYDSNCQPVTTFWHGGGKFVRPTESRIWVGCAGAQLLADCGEPVNSGFFAIDAWGRVKFTYRTIVDEGAAPPIGDVSAINIISDRQAWIYYYGDYPLVRLLDDYVCDIWTDMPVIMADSVAINESEGLALFSGGACLGDSDLSETELEAEAQRQQREILHLVELDIGKSRHVDEVHLVDGNGDRLYPGDFVTFAVGANLILCSLTEVRTAFVDPDVIKRRGG